ncbi:LacI family DNA-binding transcriptional regulator [Arsenicicoccus sp. oral taxon 190]|uniref:LacI family DNA-binding transcriptional regulator n=1 Tax=Arsenicicoccus sp. oral taxon 190 TaxID=1658671 RepID=UPI00067A2DC4|nr:LacI family DNA-binding transcriptional regulator [Arsenicicoccus sp. oral taxon 190]AKT50292.1 transcriptional regulator,sugar-binding protein [Arsenicicoccus sp. oral taxon 190]
MAGPRQSVPRRPTLRDVATAAGVSISTASLVYSGKQGVSDATAERVRAAADQLGYAGPDPRASSLRQGRSGVVAVHVEGTLGYAFQDPYAVSVLDGLAQSLDEVGMGMLLVPEPAGRSEDAARLVGGQAVDAVVFALCGPTRSPLVEQVAARGIPMVGTGAPVDDRVVQLRVDDRGATRRLLDHLLELGHEHVAMLTMPLHPGSQTGPIDLAQVEAASYPDTRDRALAFVDRLGPDRPMVQSASLSIDGSAQAAALLLDADPRPTAVVAQSDLLAAGVIRAAADRGLRVPEDLSVVGFDGVELPWFDGRLTTVEQDGRGKGRRLGELVQRLLAGEAVTDEDHPVRLRIGTTTAPPPRR